MTQESISSRLKAAGVSAELARLYGTSMRITVSEKTSLKKIQQDIHRPDGAVRMGCAESAVSNYLAE